MDCFVDVFAFASGRTLSECEHIGQAVYKTDVPSSDPSTEDPCVVEYVQVSGMFYERIRDY